MASVVLLSSISNKISFSIGSPTKNVDVYSSSYNQTG